jgi:hypothetical protein
VIVTIGVASKRNVANQGKSRYAKEKFVAGFSPYAMHKVLVFTAAKYGMSSAITLLRVSAQFPRPADNQKEEQAPWSN